MKIKNHISVFILIFFGVSLFAQKPLSGIYITSDDFKNKKLTYANPCGKEHSIKLHEFLGKKHLTVNHNGATIVLSKDSIYAFVDCEGVAHRFFKEYGSDYVIQENGPLTIYSKEVLVSGGKNFKSEVQYFFSVGLKGDIYSLTGENIKNRFPDNHKLHDAIDEFFPNDSGITQFDERHKMYRANHLLSGYLNN